VESLSKTKLQAIHVYEHGLPFSQDLASDVIDPLVKNLKRIPNILIIDGAPGTGKTTLAVEIADYINKKNGQQPLTLTVKGNKQLAFGSKELMQKAEEAAGAGFKVCIADELDFDKRNWASSFNKDISSFFREYRSLAILIIIIIQNVAWIDNRIWELGAVQGLIHLHDPEQNYTSYQVYDLENISYLLFRMDKLGMYARRKAYSFSHGYQRGQFLPLPDERQAALDCLSDAQKKSSRKKKIKKLS
jgi:hypothetical protein